MNQSCQFHDFANISDLFGFGNTHATDDIFSFLQARALENQRYFIQGTNTEVAQLLSLMEKFNLVFLILNLEC